MFVTQIHVHSHVCSSLPHMNTTLAMLTWVVSSLVHIWGASRFVCLLLLGAMLLWTFLHMENFARVFLGHIYLGVDCWVLVQAQ